MEDISDPAEPEGRAKTAVVPMTLRNIAKFPLRAILDCRCQESAR